MTERTNANRSRLSLGSGWVAAVIAGAIGFSVTAWSVLALGMYGWAVFAGVPFGVGFLSVMIRGANRSLDVGQCALTSLGAVSVLAMFLFGFALEGVICLIMAAPLGIATGVLGGLIGYVVHTLIADARRAGWCIIAMCVLMPAMIGAESAADRTPRIADVATSIIINAPPEVVWKHVVAFDELPDSRDWLFHTGIAYPKRATIRGCGVGAVRYCVFSTGAFVEPITVWDEPRLLRFDVIENPEPMQEWSLYSDIHPPHLDGFMVSEQGQFELIELPGGRTKLVGTTWYQHGLWPDAYWRIFSDFIIHRIHLRVLEHIRNRAESEADGAPS